LQEADQGDNGHEYQETLLQAGRERSGVAGDETEKKAPEEKRQVYSKRKEVVTDKGLSQQRSAGGWGRYNGLEVRTLYPEKSRPCTTRLDGQEQTKTRAQQEADLRDRGELAERSGRACYERGDSWNEVCALLRDRWMRRTHLRGRRIFQAIADSRGWLQLESDFARCWCESQGS